MTYLFFADLIDTCDWRVSDESGFILENIRIPTAFFNTDDLL